MFIANAGGATGGLPIHAPVAPSEQGNGARYVQYDRSVTACMQGNGVRYIQHGRSVTACKQGNQVRHVQYDSMQVRECTHWSA